MKNLKKLITIASFVAAIGFLQGCEKGPAEEAGENIDEMVTDAGNAIEDACEDVKEGAGAKDKDC
jgi:hypothetical protein